MANWTRRRILGAAASLSALALSGCARALQGSTARAASPAPPQPLIDAHCHLFNITDLPAARFVQIVLLKRYPRPGGPTWWERQLAAALSDIERILARRAPTAAAEAAAARGGGFAAAPATSVPLPPPDERALREQETRAETAHRRAAEAPGAEPAIMSAPRCEVSVGPSPSFGSARRWLRNLRGSRAALTRELAETQRSGGYAPRLLCPALVDYSNWLEQELISPLPDQVIMGGLLARDLSLPPVHGYVAFDPLRRALIRTGRRTIDGDWDPLALAREALRDHGFAGVKVYPPMGFRPAGNAAVEQPFPPRLVEAFGSTATLARELDISLDEIWALCQAEDAPIMTHAANSNAGGREFGRRADPAFWLDVVRSHPGLRILLGHFGGFGTFSHGQPAECRDGVPFEASWEGTIGRFVAANPDSGLFADISYLAEIFQREDRLRALAGMRRYLALDPGGRHLVFGTDWIMLGIERQYPKRPGYVRRVADFLAQCGLSEAEVADVLYGNALRFLGLDGDTRARQRLLRFYAAHGLDPSRQPG